MLGTEGQILIGDQLVLDETTNEVLITCNNIIRNQYMID